jgi:hypothetical protein
MRFPLLAMTETNRDGSTPFDSAIHPRTRTIRDVLSKADSAVMAGCISVAIHRAIDRKLVSTTPILRLQHQLQGGSGQKSQDDPAQTLHPCV